MSEITQKRLYSKRLDYEKKTAILEKYFKHGIYDTAYIAKEEGLTNAQIQYLRKKLIANGQIPPHGLIAGSM